ncbi:MAG: NCS2 family permease [Hydrogenibacillus sp.]|nr:NCS2 family permease [Hydrogenibacillus sp.]
MERFFRVRERGSTVRREVIAGLTTFLSMAYALFVVPAVLSDAGMDKAAVFVATALAAFTGTAVMALYANYPIAQAPGMGLIAFFAYTVVIGMGIPWQTALAGVFASGLIFFLLTVTKIRETIINAIPQSLKMAVGAGIGLFIALIGFKNAGLVVIDGGAGILRLGDIHAPETLLALFGLAVTAALLVRRVGGAVFYGMLITAAVGMLFGLIPVPRGLSDVIGPVPSIAPTLAKLDWPALIHPTAEMLFIVFTIFFVDFFDATGTIVAIAQQAGLMKDGRIVGGGRALTSDAIATMAGAWFGTSTTTSYIESSAGVAAGGRTGLTALVTAILFLLSLFFAPLLSIITLQVTAPALIIVGVLMAGNLRHIDWTDLGEAVPAFITVVLMPYTYSIANGIAFGFVSYVVLKLVQGKVKSVHPVLYVLALIFLIYFAWVVRA